MVNQIKILRSDAPDVWINKVNDPSIEEILNGQFTFSFTTYIDGVIDYLDPGALVEVDGIIFKVATRNKIRAEIPSVSIDCEHVSYLLSKEDDLEGLQEEYEDTPGAIVSNLLVGTGFTLQQMAFHGPIYFRPSAKTIRGIILELANFLGGEVIWNNYHVSIAQKRGSFDGAIFEVGKNVINLREFSSIENGEIQHAYELDVVDLAQSTDYEDVPGYQLAKMVNLGDTVTIVDTDLKINVNLRILRYVRNPFQKETPQISVGQLIPDFLSYFKDDEEDEVEEDGVEVTLTFAGTGNLSVSTKEKKLQSSSAMFYGTGSLSVDYEYEYEPTTDLLLIDFIVDTTQALILSGVDITDDYKNGEELIFPTVIAKKENSKVKIRILESALSTYDVLVKAGSVDYTNSHFTNGLLTFDGSFPSDVKIFIFAGELSPETLVKAYAVSTVIGDDPDNPDPVDPVDPEDPTGYVNYAEGWLTEWFVRGSGDLWFLDLRGIDITNKDVWDAPYLETREPHPFDEFWVRLADGINEEYDIEIESSQSLYTNEEFSSTPHGDTLLIYKNIPDQLAYGEEIQTISFYKSGVLKKRFGVIIAQAKMMGAEFVEIEEIDFSENQEDLPGVESKLVAYIRGEGNRKWVKVLNPEYFIDNGIMGYISPRVSGLLVNNVLIGEFGLRPREDTPAT